MKTFPFALLGLGAACCAMAALGRVRRDHETAVTELQLLQEALATHAREAACLDHEFRTPIGAAAAALELLMTSMDDPAIQAEAREVIARQLGRMTALTERLRQTAQRLGP